MAKKKRKEYRPYEPVRTGYDVSILHKVLPDLQEGTEGQLDRETLEVSIANAKLKFRYQMRGTLDAALASGAIPHISKLPSGEVTLIGWSDAEGNLLLV